MNEGPFVNSLDYWQELRIIFSGIFHKMHHFRIAINESKENQQLDKFVIIKPKGLFKRSQNVIKNILCDLNRFLKVLQNILSRTSHPEVGPYIHILVTLYWISSVCLLTPIYLTFCPNKKLYVVRQCHILQRIAYVLCLVGMQPSLIRQGLTVWDYLLSNSGNLDVTPYFDFFNEVFHNACMFVHGYIHYCQVPMIEKYVKVLQTTPLIQLQQLPIWKARFVAVYMFIVITWSGLYFVVFAYQIDWSSPTAFIISGQKSARYVFWLPENWNVSTTTALVTIATRYYHGIYHHTAHSTFCYVPFFPLFFMSGDFFSSILTKKLSVEKVLDYYEDYKEVLAKGNRYFNQYTFCYIAILITYHSVHVFDILNSDNFLWKFNVGLYVYMGSIVFYYPIKTLLHTKKLKKWLWIDENYMKLSRQQLSLVLHDQYAWVQGRKGIKCGRFLVISPEQAGKVFQQVCSMALIIKLSSYHAQLRMLKS